MKKHPDFEEDSFKQNKSFNSNGDNYNKRYKKSVKHKRMVPYQRNKQK